MRCLASMPLLLLPLLAVGACVTGSYQHGVVDEPVAASAIESLRPEVDTLATCLQRLGAPQRVFEYRVAADGSAGMALLWYWRDAVGWGIDVSSGDDSVPGSVSFDALAAELPGCMLWFGPELVLERWRQGPVGELAPAKRRPSSHGD